MIPPDDLTLPNAKNNYTYIKYINQYKVGYIPNHLICHRRRRNCQR